MRESIYMIRDILLASVCILVIGGMVFHPARYTRTFRVIFIPVLAAILIALLVDIVWPIRAVVLLAGAGMCLAVEIVIMLSPSAGWPRLYVTLLKVGYAALLLALCIFAAVRMHLVSRSLTVHLVACVVGVVGFVLLAVAYNVLRPKGRPMNGVL